MHLPTTILLGLLPLAHALTAWQQRDFTAPIPSTPSVSFANYTSASSALTALASALASTTGNATIAYPGSVAYGSTVARVWTQQRKTYPDAIVYPSTAEEVSILLQFYSSAYHHWDEAFAIMCGGHADFGGAQSTSMIIDLQNLGATEILSNTTAGNQSAILKIGGGAEAGDVYSALDGTGWAFLGPRAASIGVGGFLLGGGIAFQTSRYGVGVDSVVGLEVVLVDGTIVYANPYNEHSDVFWAATGGGWLASFGVVTQFYVQAYPDPGSVYVGTITWAAEEAAEDVFDKAAEWWETNTDPDAVPALIYYFKDPDQPSSLVPIKDRRFTLQLNAMYFGGGQAEFNASFGGFYENASTITFASYSLKTLDGYLLTNYPYGYHREFYGKSHTNSTREFYEETFGLYKELIEGMLARGEDPGHTLWVDEFEFHAWNGAGPTSDSDTAWPHSTSGHITLTSGEWSSDNTTAFMHARDNATMAYLKEFQSGIDEPTIYDYPNYIAPHSVTKEVWGEDNYNRLVAIKQKYDPNCLLSRGRVPATEGCVSRGLANTL